MRYARFSKCLLIRLSLTKYYQFRLLYVPRLDISLTTRSYNSNSYKACTVQALDEFQILTCHATQCRASHRADHMTDDAIIGDLETRKHEEMTQTDRLFLVL